MDQVAQLDPKLAVAAQLRPGDLVGLARKGFRTLINNRPDGEAMFGQPSSTTMHEAAARAGLQSHYLPIVAATLGAPEVRRFHAIVREADGPTVAYCKSGMRSALLWVLAEAAFAGRPIAELVDHAAQSGQDLAPARDLIDRVLKELRTQF